MKLAYVANSCRHNRNLDRLISAMQEGIRVNQFYSYENWEFSQQELEVAKDWGILLRSEPRITYECYIPCVWHVRFAREVAYEYGNEESVDTPMWVQQKPLARILESLGIEWYKEEDVSSPLAELLNYGYYVKHDENYVRLLHNLDEMYKKSIEMEIVNKFLTGLGRKEIK